MPSSNNSNTVKNANRIIDVDTEHFLTLQRKDQAQFNNWLHFTYLEKKGLTPVEVIGVLTFLLGAATTMTNYDPLGIGFGKLVADNISLEELEKLFEVFFGVAAFVPVAALVGLPAKAEVEFYLNFILRKPQIPSREDRKIARAISTVAIFIVSWFTGVPFYKLLQDALNGVPILSTALPVCLMMTCYAGTMYISRLFLEDYLARIAMESDEIKAMREMLSQKIDMSKSVIKSMQSNLLQEFVDEHIGVQDSNDTPASVDNFLQQLFVSLPFEYNLDECFERIPSAEVSDDNGRVATKWFGALCGLVACYVFYSLAINTANAWLDSAGETDEDVRESVRYAIASIAMLSNIFFNSTFASRGAVNIYDGFMSGQCPSVTSAFAHVIAIFSSTPSLYLNVVAAQEDNKLYALLPFTALGTLLARSTAFEELLFKLQKRCKRQTITETRSDLLELLSAFQNQIPLLKPEVIKYLHEKYIRAPQQNTLLVDSTDSRHSSSVSLANSRNNIHREINRRLSDANDAENRVVASNDSTTGAYIRSL